MYSVLEIENFLLQHPEIPKPDEILQRARDNSEEGHISELDLEEVMGDGSHAIRFLKIAG